MSMNIYIEATREVKVVKTGKIVLQKIHWEAWQTPTTVTYSIVASDDPAQCYRDWAMLLEPYIQDIYAEDDIWQERDPIGTQVINPSIGHIEEFDAWLKMCDEEGYTVTYYVV